MYDGEYRRKTDECIILLGCFGPSYRGAEFMLVLDSARCIAVGGVKCGLISGGKCAEYAHVGKLVERIH